MAEECWRRYRSVCVCVCVGACAGEKIACPEILIKCLEGAGAGVEEHMARARSSCGYLGSAWEDDRVANMFGNLLGE